MLKRILIAGLLLLAVTATACGDDDKDADSASGGDAPPVFTIKASDTLAEKKFTFALPENVKGGAVTLRLQNDGQELHDFQLAKAVEGHTLDELLAQVASEEAPLSEWVIANGGIGTTAPGQTNDVTVDLEPGKYWYFCSESSAAGDAEDAEELSHATHGMSGEIEIVGDSGADFPEATSSIAVKDYDFAVDGIKAGKNTFEFTNTGDQIHHALFFPLAEGATFEQAKAAFQSDEEPTGPPPVDFESGQATTVISKGVRQLVTVDLPAGTYAMVCFMPDRGTAGPPHALPPRNMIKELVVS